MNTSHKNFENFSFEEAMTELEALVKKLEEGQLSLEEAIDTFEKGSLLQRHCEKKLLAAKMRVEQIIDNGEGNIKINSLGAA